MTHDSSDTGTTVPIQRYDWSTFGPLPSELGGYVTYTTHLHAMQQQRDTALREALAAIEAWHGKAESGYSDSYLLGLTDAISAIKELQGGTDA